jgi:hypothetical protein
MPSDGNSGKIPSASLLQGSQAASSIKAQYNGKYLPQGGKGASAVTGAIVPAAAQSATKAAAAAKAPAAGKAPLPEAHTADPQSLVNLLNSHLNDSGRPDQFRVDPASANKLIQQINPANGEVVGEFSVDEFPALARSIGASGLLVDSLA